MSFAHSLIYFTHHVESIIQWLFLSILVLTAALVARSLFGKSEKRSPTSGVDADIQTALKKILEQSGQSGGTPSFSLGANSGLGSGNDSTHPAAGAQLEFLKSELQARDAELKALKAGGGAAANSEEAATLKTKIKELEAKLAEYEILEDDIADLSLYKEENARLKGELERLNRGEPAAEPVTEAASEAVPEPNKQGEDIVAEFAEAVGKEAATAAASDLNEITELAEVAQAAPEAPPEPKPEPVQAAQPAAPAAAPAPQAKKSQEPSDDLFAEFAQPQDEGGLDTEKMMQEMAALVSMPPAKDSGLQESIDTEKMAEEAHALQKSRSS